MPCYIAIRIDDQSFTVSPVTTIKPEEPAQGKVFEFDLADFAAVDLAQFGNPVGPTARSIRDWIEHESGLIGADLLDAKRNIKKNVLEYINGIARVETDSLATARLFRPDLDIPGVTRGCPCCGEKNVAAKPCMYLRGGNLCCPFLVCLKCGYEGPHGYNINDMINRWNDGEINRFEYASKIIDAANISITGRSVALDLGRAVAENSEPSQRKVIGLCAAHPQVTDVVAGFLRKVIDSAKSMLEEIET